MHALPEIYLLLHVLLQKGFHLGMQRDCLIEERIAAGNVGTDVNQIAIALVARVELPEALYLLEFLRLDQRMQRAAYRLLDVDGGVVALISEAA